MKETPEEIELRTKILKVMEKDARISMHDLGAILGLPEATVTEAVRVMEEQNIICGYHTLVNWENTSRELVTALVEVRVTPQRGKGFDKIAEEIGNYPEVSELYMISGSYDFVLILREENMHDIAMFVSEKLSSMESVVNTSTHFVLKEYKEHGTVLACADKEEKMERMVRL